MQINGSGDTAIVTKLDVLKRLNEDRSNETVRHEALPRLKVLSTQKQERLIPGAMAEARKAATKAGYAL